MSSTERVAICRTKLVFLKTVARCCITTVTRVTLCWCTSWIDEKRKKKENKKGRKERKRERERERDRNQTIKQAGNK